MTITMTPQIEIMLRIQNLIDRINNLTTEVSRQDLILIAAEIQELSRDMETTKFLKDMIYDLRLLNETALYVLAVQKTPGTENATLLKAIENLKKDTSLTFLIFTYFLENFTP